MKRICILLIISGFSIFGAKAQVTSLTLNSDSGDYIGAGQFLFFTPADGGFTATHYNGQAVFVSFNTPNYDHFWFVDIAAPAGQPLTVGTYSGAMRFSSSSAPGLDVGGDGRGCNETAGSFQVLEASYGADGTVNSFDAIFEQHCEGFAPALHGEIRYNAHPTVTLTAPVRLTVIEGQPVNFTVSATDVLSRHVVLSATGVPSGASFVDNGDSTGTFNWSSSRGGNYLLAFQGDNLSGNVGGTYSQITVTAQNDDFNNATVVTSIPFSASQDVTSATIASDDPFGCYGSAHSVWYAFTPATNIRLEANTVGSNYDTTLSVFTGSRGALTQVACNDDSNGTLASRVRFDAVAGTTYYLMASSLSYYVTSPANLVFNLLQGPPPLTITPTLTQFGSVSPTTGTVTLSGIVNASQPTFVTIYGRLKQVHGSSPLDGYFSAFVACDAGITPWSVTVQSLPAVFHGRSAALFTAGKATVSATASAYDFDTGEYIERNLSATITLRGKK